jgi:6-phosphofructokinase 1
MREAAFDVASMAATSTKVFVLEVMGRHAGWITAAVGMADDADTPIPLGAVSRSRSTKRGSPR